MATELKRLDFSANSFAGKSGRKYIIHNSIAVGRERAMTKYENLAATGLDFESRFANDRKAYDALNSPGGAKVADASVILHNNMLGVSRNLESRDHPIYMLCTVFCCYEGEDLGRWTEAEAAEKVEDWSDYDREDFFVLALNFIGGYRAALKTVSQNFLMSMEEAEN